jgi:hypothetical protein
VTFYIAGNAANGNGSSSGDFIYTDVFMYDESHAGLDDEPTTWSVIKDLYR